MVAPAAIQMSAEALRSIVLPAERTRQQFSRVSQNMAALCCQTVFVHNGRYLIHQDKEKAVVSGAR